MKAKFIFTVALFIFGCGGYAQAQQYRVWDTLRIASNGGWDYIALSPVSADIYVTHMNHVNILDRNTGDSVSVISNTPGVHGVAFAPWFGKGYITNGKANTVTVFDMYTYEVIRQIKTGANPDAVMYDPFSQKIFVCDGRGKDLCIIDPSNDMLVSVVPLGGKPETAVSDGIGHLYVNIEDKNELVVVNTRTYAIEKRFTIGNGEEPSGLAIDVNTKRLFIGCGNKLLVVIDAVGGNVIKELPIGDGCDGVAFDVAEKRIFCANGDGTLTVVEERSATDFVVIENVPTQKGARTLTLDQDTHQVYLPAADLSDTIPPGQKRPGMIPGTFRVLVVGR